MFLEVVTALTEGDTDTNLHTQDVPEALFDLDNESEKIRIGNQLVGTLGESFRAAPLWEESTVQLVEKLHHAAQEQFVQMDSEGMVMSGYELIDQNVTAQLQKSLEAAVKKRLS